MKADGRTVIPHRLSDLPDTTSSGCPVRHSADDEKRGARISGVAVTNLTCAAAVAEVLTAHREIVGYRSDGGRGPSLPGIG